MVPCCLVVQVALCCVGIRVRMPKHKSGALPGIVVSQQASLLDRAAWDQRQDEGDSGWLACWGKVAAGCCRLSCWSILDVPRRPGPHEASSETGDPVHGGEPYWPIFVCQARHAACVVTIEATCDLSIYNMSLSYHEHAVLIFSHGFQKTLCLQYQRVEVKPRYPGYACGLGKLLASAFSFVELQLCSLQRNSRPDDFWCHGEHR